jgi:predicted DNA-binding transcriptional regulator AlpA
MKRADALATLPCAPAALRLDEAAAYVGVSVSHFLKAREKGVLPKPVNLLGAKVYLRRDLDQALALLPREGGDEPQLDDGLDPWGEDEAL